MSSWRWTSCSEQSGEKYDVGIIFSDDTDLNPALEAVGEIFKAPGHAELAGWRDLSRRGPRIVKSGGQTVYSHLLGHEHYLRVCDAQDYNQPAARKPRPPKRG